MKKIVLAPFIWLAATIFLVEEFIWDGTARLMARLGAVRLVHAVEQRIAALPPKWALFAFMLPVITIIPAKLIGVEAIAHGHWLLGILIILAAKLIGVALFSRIFNLTRAALMQVAWFCRLYAWVMGYRNRIHAYLEQWEAYQRVKRRIKAIMDGVKGAVREND
jgi:hypothetical protein